MTEQVPPNDLATERALLGSLLQEPQLFDAVSDRLDREDFYGASHRFIWDAMRAASVSAEMGGEELVRAELHRTGKLQAAGGDEYLLELGNHIRFSEHVNAQARIIRDLAQVRRTINVARNIVTRGYQPIESIRDYFDQAETAILTATDRSYVSEPKSIGAIAGEVYAQIRSAAERGTRLTGVTTGFRELDALTTGLHGGDLIVVAARPRMGKSALAGHIALEAAADGEPVAVFSHEMPAEQWVQRILSGAAQINLMRMRIAAIGDNEWEPLTNAVAGISDLPIQIDDTSALTIHDIRSRCRRIRQKQGGLRIIIVDYLQLMRSTLRGRNREAEVGDISRGLKALAKELRCTVVALSQLNRAVESRPLKDRRPELSDLRESGAIEQDADSVWMLYRDEVYRPDTDEKGICEIIVRKQRNGPERTIKVRFTKQFTQFTDAEAEYVHDEEFL